MAELFVVTSRQRLAGHDIAGEQIVTFLDQPAQGGAGAGVTVGVVDQQGRVEQVPHLSRFPPLGARRSSRTPAVVTVREVCRGRSPCLYPPRAGADRASDAG